MTDLERVARAIWCAVYSPAPDTYPTMEDCRDAARAAIEALMEVSEAVIDAGDKAEDCPHPKCVFQAMLRAVLEGK